MKNFESKGARQQGAPLNGSHRNETHLKGARRPAWALVVPLLGLLTACGTVDTVSQWWKGGTLESPRLAAGVSEYTCDGSKVFQMRMETGTQSAWVRFPDREFRVDPVPGDATGRYTNGRTTLNLKGEEAFLTEGTAVTYANCKRTASG